MRDKRRDKRRNHHRNIPGKVVWAKITHPISGVKSYLTKKGPGVEAKAREFFNKLHAWEQDVAIDHGWFPRSWK